VIIAIIVIARVVFKTGFRTIPTRISLRCSDSDRSVSKSSTVVNKNILLHHPAWLKEGVHSHDGEGGDDRKFSRFLMGPV
jgi:hypothetical protein